MDTEIKQSSFEGHALVELMGHRRHAGFVTTEHIGAAAFLKVVTDEVPATRYTLEKDAWIDGEYMYAGSVMECERPRREALYGSASVYAINPCTIEQVNRAEPMKHTVIERAPRPLLAEATALEPKEEDEGVY